MGSLIITGSSQENNAFTQQRYLYSLDMLFGANTTSSTPTIVYGTNTTYRFAVRMPSIGFLHSVRVHYYAKTGGSGVGTFDMRLYRAPFDAADFSTAWDRLYEKAGIVYDTIWEDHMSDAPIPFYNRIAYVGNDPNNTRVSNPRNFLWLELEPKDATVVAPFVKVNLMFEV